MSNPGLALTTLFAVHISDGVLSFPWVAGGFVLAAFLLAVARPAEDQIARTGLFTAAFFVATQVHIPTGVVSVHLMMNGVVGIVLRRSAPVAVAIGLLLQALLFGHGGLLALGVNTCVLAIPALVAGYGYPPLRRAVRAGWWPFACGCVIGLVAFLLTVLLNYGVLVFGGQDEFETPAKVILLGYLLVAPGEAILTGIVVQYLERVKPEWLACHPSPSGKTSSNGTSH